jgi:hypothetical protein
LWPAATTDNLLRFTAISKLTDEFSSRNSNKWEFNGDIDSQTGCPAWYGPNPLDLDPLGRNVDVRDGSLRLWTNNQPRSYFESREYFCVSQNRSQSKGYCNWDTARTNSKCASTDSSGATVYADWMCKKAPYCFPAGQTLYKTYVGALVASKASMQYGYVEVSMRTPPSTSYTVPAAWMTTQFYDPPYTRINPQKKYENPSLIRGRHWAELDWAELPMSPALQNQYIPNVHLQSCNDGRFTSTTPPGPVIQDSDIAGSRANSMNWNPGSVYASPAAWSNKYNVFGMWWSPDEIRFIVNGVERVRYRNRYMHMPQYLRVSILSDKEWLGSLPALTTSTMYVDYIRAWKVRMSDTVAANSAVLPGTLRFNDKMGVALPPPIMWPQAGVSRVLSADSTSVFDMVRQFNKTSQRPSWPSRSERFKPSFRSSVDFRTPVDSQDPMESRVRSS